MLTGGRKFTARASILLLILVGVAIIEWWMGRSPICTCGRVKLWTSDAYGPENSQMLADWYSLSHVVHGLLLYSALWRLARSQTADQRFVFAFLIEAAWEIVENSPIIIDRYRSATIALGYTGDSIINSVGDIAFMSMGFWIARVLPTKWAVVLGLALELVSFVAIRDNLTLNVLMLAYPIDAVRAWQSR